MVHFSWSIFRVLDVSLVVRWVCVWMCNTGCASAECGVVVGCLCWFCGMLFVLLYDCVVGGVVGCVLVV